MALGRMGGMNKWFAYIAVGFLTGILSTTLGGLVGSITGFLPGILGSIAGWAIQGFVLVLVIGIILKAFGARK